jgi:hypothetical protein
MLSLNFTSNLAIAGAVPACAQKLWMVRQTTHSLKNCVLNKKQ